MCVRYSYAHTHTHADIYVCTHIGTCLLCVCIRNCCSLVHVPAQHKKKKKKKEKKQAGQKKQRINEVATTNFISSLRGKLPKDMDAICKFALVSSFMCPPSYSHWNMNVCVYPWMSLYTVSFFCFFWVPHLGPWYWMSSICSVKLFTFSLCFALAPAPASRAILFVLVLKTCNYLHYNMCMVCICVCVCVGYMCVCVKLNSPVGNLN